MRPGRFGRLSLSTTPASRLGAGQGRNREAPWRAHPRKQQTGPDRVSRPYTSQRPVVLRLELCVSTGAVVLGRRLQGDTCRGRTHWARGRTHQPAGGAVARLRPRRPRPNVLGLGRGARWEKGTQAATTLTWQHLLLRRGRQQSRRPPAPSSATASSLAAATNRSSGTNRHNRRCPGACRGPELQTAGRGPGGEGTLSGPSALGRGPGERRPRPVRAEGPGRQENPEAAPRGRQGGGHRRGLVCYCRLRPFPRGACRESAGGGGARPVARAAQRGGAQVRKSTGCREGGLSASSRCQSACHLTVLP